MDLTALDQTPGPRKLDIGCGTNPIGSDWIGVDAIAYPQVQIVGDALGVLQSIDSGSINAIFTAHFLEHLEDLDGMLEEMTRVLGPGASLEVRVPHWANPWFWSDPTHRRTFGLYTFDYLAESDLFVRPVPDYGKRLPLMLRDVHLKFRIDPGFGLRTRAMEMLERAVNHSRRAQEFYEVNIAQMVGCDEVRFRLVRI